MQNTELDPDDLRANNWLHDWAPGFDDIYDGAFPLNAAPDRGSRSGVIR